MNKKGKYIIALRKNGKTHGEIAKFLNIPKSTVGWWLRNVKISKALEKQILERSRKKWRKNIAIYNNYYGKIRSELATKIRENYKIRASKEIGNLTKKGLKFIGSSLYWAEGNIKNRNSLRFSNSNPLIIKTIMKFFREVCKIPDKKIKARVHIYPGLGKKKATNYWKKITGLNKNNFHKPQVQTSRASRGKRPRNTLPYGTLHLTAGNTEITCKVKGWIQGISEKI